MPAEQVEVLKVGERRSVRFDISAQTADGLDTSGIAQLVEAQDRLHVRGRPSTPRG